MNKIDQILNYIKQINERLNLWVANAKKIEELPEMETVNPESLMMVSELEEGIWTSKKLEIQTIIDGISLAGQNNTVREILLGEITAEHDLEYLFDNNAISVGPTELVVLIVLQTISAKQIQRQFLWKLGKGDFAPIGSSDLNTKVLELQPKFINEIIADELTAAPDAIVYDFGTITDPIIDVINVSTPVFDFSNDEKIYYIRFTKDDIKYLYNFVGVDGEYGDSALQMVESDLVLVYSSEIIDVVSLIEGKLDKDGYPGTAQDLNLRIGVLEGAQGKGNRFTGKSYALWSSTGLTYNVVYTSYYLNDILYPGGIMPKTLSASDPTNPRFDTIAVDATGPIVITGTPSASPEVPSTDPNTQLAITSVLVQAGATTPAGVSNEDIYKENAEWTAVSNNGTVDFNATTTPFQGSKHIDCGAFTNGQYLRFTDSVVNQIADFTEIGITLNLKSIFTNSAKFSVRFYNGTTAVSSTVVISSGAYNFDRTIVNAYQMVIVPISAFTFTSSSFDRVEIVMNGTNANGFRMDNIILYKGSGSASPEQNAITTIITDSGVVNATQKDDTIQLIGGLGIDITSSGKVITISGTTDLSDYYTKSETDTALDLKVDKDGTKVLSDNNYSTSEKNKLASIDATHYLPPLQTTVQLSALPQASISDKARVYVENELSDYFYDATASSGDIAPDDQTGGVGFWRQVAVGGETAASIKTKYESNPDTNAFTDAEQTKLAGISGTNTGNETAATIATINHGATAKTTLVDGDEITGQDSANSFSLIRVTCLNIYNYLKTKFDSVYQAVLVSGTNIKTVNTQSLLGSGNLVTPDMDTTTAQDVSGLKTFLAGKFGLRNTANTFTSFFASAVTASRTWTWPDKNGTVAMTSDIPTNTVATGTQNYIPKYNNAGGTQIGNSRLKDDGTNIGVDSIWNLLGDFMFGYAKSSRMIGIEDSISTQPGRDLTVRPGRAINFNPLGANFTPLGQVPRFWHGVAVNPTNGDVYSCVFNGDIYKQTAGSGNFNPLSQGARNWFGIAINPTTGDVYATVAGGDIYKQTASAGNFNPLGQTSRTWYGIAVNPTNGDVYASSNGDIYKQTAGSGNFIALGQTSRTWQGIAVNPTNGDVYSCVFNGDIYKQTAGSGNFNPLSQGSRIWQFLTINPTSGDVYATADNGDIYKQTASSGNFISLSQGNKAWRGISINTSTLDIYASVANGDIYILQNSALGAPNLNGGTLKLIAGTGKGTGQSRVQIITGVKTASGTDMQIETVRAEFDESGNYKRIGTPVYADNAAALAGGLTAGMEYRTSTGVKMEVY